MQFLFIIRFIDLSTNLMKYAASYRTCKA